MGRNDEDVERQDNESKGESWLYEQSFITDSDYAEVLNIKLQDDKYLRELISNTLFSRRKQSKKQFLYEPSTPRFDRRPERKKKEADKHKLSLPYIPKSRSLMRQSHDQSRMIPRLDLNFDSAPLNEQLRPRRQDSQFIDITYRFSAEEVEATDWYSLVHKKDLRRAARSKMQFTSQQKRNFPGIAKLSSSKNTSPALSRINQQTF